MDYAYIPIEAKRVDLLTDNKLSESEISHYAACNILKLAITIFEKTDSQYPIKFSLKKREEPLYLMENLKQLASKYSYRIFRKKGNTETEILVFPPNIIPNDLLDFEAW